ncbi:hypothetical protein [Streptomyces sp. Isolate_45]|uniref:hypothetical protein n=1 Tax=Streptomyces sp. Isolate_45 TaxID=2950111 RepID=UPI002481B2D0|nr:hypothetical protein [Streptomyces sp. Isolate_45]MDA5282767.1 hypothetical protein [Streptomyces sp. Isolate_45]
MLHSENGVTRDEVIRAQYADLDVGAGLAPHIDLLLERRLLVLHTGGGLRITEEGRVLHRSAAQTQQAGRRQVHTGISDEEYLTTIQVPQRMIRNSGGDVSQT